MFVPIQFQKKRSELNLDTSEVNWELLLAIDFAFYHTDETYDRGLSFFDRLKKKLQKPFPALDWDVDRIKYEILHSDTPELIYQYYIQLILMTQDTVSYYGI